MTLQLHTVTMDCRDAARVGAFWAAALGRPLDHGAASEFASISADGTSPSWYFNQVPEIKSTKNRVHVDLQSDGRQAEVERLVSLGATRLADHDADGTAWTVLADVEGNEFCVV
jgi:catechol 2,3-dioxygenase-like lactoylglutathione lyase family enzyme